MSAAAALDQPLPVKTREIQHFVLDSTKWNNFDFRDDDIVISTAYKSGTTWVQNMVVQLCYQGREIPANTVEIYPWLDLRFPPIAVQRPMLEAMKERRQLKTHLRLDALVFSPKAKYIYVGRDGRDCYMSIVNHYRKLNENFYGAMTGPGLVTEPLPKFSEDLHSETKLFDRWIREGFVPGENDGFPFW
jgi:aryl sulfotransferase